MDFDSLNLKDVPSFKAILKLVLKSQIQFLIEQLSDHAGEDCIVLTANALEGSLSHLGSRRGNRFIQDNSDIKSKFLGFCLKGVDDGNTDNIHESQPQNKPQSTAVHGQFVHCKNNGRKRKLSDTQNHHKATFKVSDMVAMDRASRGIVSIDTDMSADLHHGRFGLAENGADVTKSFEKPSVFKNQPTGVPALQNHEFKSETGEEHWSGEGCRSGPVIKIEVAEDEDPPNYVSDKMFSHSNSESSKTESDGGLSFGDFVSWDTQRKPELDLREAVHSPGKVLQISNPYSPHSETLRNGNGGVSMRNGRHISSEMDKLPEDTDSAPQYSNDDLYSKEKDAFTCDVCFRVFNRKYNMEQHRQLHFGIKQFTCRECNKQFSRQDRLKRHCLRHHSGITLGNS